MSSRFGIFLRGYRLGAGSSLVDMALRLRTTPERLRLAEDGQIFPPAAQRDDWARAMNFENWLALDAQWRDNAVPPPGGPHSAGKVAIINKAPAGYPEDYEEYGVHSGMGADYADAPPGYEGTALFAFIVVGQSMSGAYEEDDLIYCRPVRADEKLPAGSPVFVRFGSARDNRCTFKIFFPGNSDDTIELRPANPLYEILRVHKSDISAMGLAVYRVPKYYLSMDGPRLVDE